MHDRHHIPDLPAAARANPAWFGPLRDRNRRLPDGIMGSVGVSPMDPVFWAHHTNIDRLYECWLRSQNGRLPTDPAVVNAHYWVVDENGTVVQRTARDMLTTDQLNYSYTQGSDCAPAAPQMMVAEAAAVLPVTTVQVPANGRILRIKEAKPDGSSLFEVVLIGAKGQRVSAGVISTFGEEHHHAPPETFDFDIAAQLLTIGAGKSVRVEFVPISGIEGDTGKKSREGRGQENHYPA